MKNPKLFALAGCLLASGLLAQTADDDVAQGRTSLAARDLAGAYSKFNAALVLSPTNGPANVLAAATRLLLLPQQSAGSNFLNRLGFPAAGRDIYNWTSALPRDAGGDFIVPPTLNSTNAIAFFRTNIMPALGASRTNLARILDTDFTLSLTADETAVADVTLDYGDIVLLQAELQAAEFLGYTLNAHNFGVVVKRLQDLSKTNNLTLQQVLTDNKLLLNKANARDLAASKGAFTNAIALYLRASDFIRNLRPPGAERLFELPPAEAANEAGFRADLATALASVDHPVKVDSDPQDTLSVYAGSYFAGTKSLRSLMPQFNRNRYVFNSLPDYTFGGILVGEPAVDTELFLRQRLGHSYAGIYFDYAGYIALIVRTNQQATLEGFDPSSLSGVVANFAIDDHGAWQFNTNGFSGSGQIAADGSFIGQLDSTNGPGFLQGAVVPPDAGAYQSSAGYYTGNWSVTGGGSGNLQAILSANGDLSYSFDTGNQVVDGGYALLDGIGNTFDSFSVNVIEVVGTNNPVTHTITGSLTLFDSTPGKFTLSLKANIPSEAPPSITTAPQNQVGKVGMNVTFSVKAAGSAPLCYQWSFNGAPISYGTSAALVVSNVQWASAGTYSVQVRNCVGATNVAADLIVVQAGVLSPLYSFGAVTDEGGDVLDGAYPYAGLVQGKDGNFYGTTEFGGLNDSGTVFKVTPSGMLTTLYAFTGDTDGATPMGDLMQGPKGVLYGTAHDGGDSGFGTVFGITTNGALTPLASFEYTDGANPHAGLVQGKDGSLYGTTENGGEIGAVLGNGSVFRITTNGPLTSLASFSFDNGGSPEAGLIQGGDGQFYGTTSIGGEGGFGNVFRVTTGGVLTSLVSFYFTNGATPYAGLVQGKDGSFYGTTSEGGNPDGIGPAWGTVFKVTTNGTLTTLYSFGSVTDLAGNPLDGATPYARLLLAKDGNFYGTTSSGGTPDTNGTTWGTIFKLTPGGALTTLYSFTGGSDGGNPAAGLVQGTDGNLYGTTHAGGDKGDGTVFRFTPDVAPPTLTITAPTRGQRVTNTVTQVTVTGRVNDNGVVAGVQYQLNGLGWNPATYTNGSTNWSAVVTPAPGTNVVQVVAADQSGNLSATNVSFYYVVNALLAIEATGQGTLTPNYSNAMLEIGHSYTTKAAPINGHVFSHWVVSTNFDWIDGAVRTNATLTFLMESNLTLQVNFVDVTQPKLNILAPKAGQRVTNTVTPVTVAGNASDNVRVTNVQFQLNNGDWAVATPTNGGVWTNWTAIVTPIPGTNGVKAYAVDATGNRSTTNGMSFYYVVPSPLTLITNGAGTITRNFSGLILEVGRGYTVTGVPGSGQVFSNWVDGAGIVITNSAVLSFQMQSNLVLQVNFIPNPFLPVQGTYNGLFYDTNGVRQESSGFFTLTLTAKGAYSGNLQMGSSRLPFAGQFDVAGNASLSVSRSRTNALAGALLLDLAPGGDRLSGSISDGHWLAELNADRAFFSSTTNPATAFAGNYTMIIPGSDDDVSVPHGDGYGAVTVAAGGGVTLTGALGDGTALKTLLGQPLAAPVSKNGQWPVYAPLYNGKGSLVGWMTFAGSPEDLEGWLSWIKPASTATKFYTNGFMTVVTNVAGSRYTQPSGTNRVMDLTNGIVVFDGGNLGIPFTNTVFLTPGNKLTNSSPNPLAFTLTLASGIFNGTVTVPGTARNLPFNGALLTNRNVGSGYFLGTNLSGRVFLMPQ